MKRLIAAICLFLASVSVSVAQQDRLRVVTTTADLRSLAKAIGAERVNVSSLVGSGETPEEYQPKLQDAEILKDAQVVVRAAPGIDPWFDKLLARTAPETQPAGHQPRRARLSRCLASRSRPTIRSASAPASPARAAPRAAGPIRITGSTRKARTSSPRRCWKCFRKPIRRTRNITQTNRKTFLARLDGKINEWQSRLLPLRDEPMIAFHDDWSYFANRFRLNIVDFMAARDRAPPKRAKIAELTKLIKTRRHQADPGGSQSAGAPRQPAGAADRRQGRAAGRFGRRIAADRRLHLDVRRQRERAGGGEERESKLTRLSSPRVVSSA